MQLRSTGPQLFYLVSLPRKHLISKNQNSIKAYASIEGEEWLVYIKPQLQPRPSTSSPFFRVLGSVIIIVHLYKMLLPFAHIPIWLVPVAGKRGIGEIIAISTAMCAWRQNARVGLVTTHQRKIFIDNIPLKFSHKIIEKIGKLKRGLEEGECHQYTPVFFVLFSRFVRSEKRNFVERVGVGLLFLYLIY